MVTISFGFGIPILVILAQKRPKKGIFGSEFWSRQQQKCYRNPLLGHFETPKGAKNFCSGVGYGRVNIYYQNHEHCKRKFRVHLVNIKKIQS